MKEASLFSTSNGTLEKSILESGFFHEISIDFELLDWVSKGSFACLDHLLCTFSGTYSQ